MNKILIFVMISFLSFVGILKADGHKPDIVDTAVVAYLKIFYIWWN